MRDIEDDYEFPSGEWDADIANYQLEPSVKKYLVLRDVYPDKDPSLDRYSGIDQLYALKPLLEKFSIESVDVAACMDADPAAIDRVSLKLLALLEERREQELAGDDTLQSRGVAITDSLINYLISIILESMERYNEPTASSSLFLLMREQLGGQNMGLYRSYQKYSRKGSVVAIMASSRNLGMACSLGQVAIILGVNKSALSRMFGEGELEKLIKEERARPVVDFLPFEDEDPIIQALPRKVREQRP